MAKTKDTAVVEFDSSCPKSVCSRIAGEHLQQVTETDLVLREIVENQGGQPTASQLGYFAALGWDVVKRQAYTDRSRRYLHRELTRMRRVVTQLAIAGTAKDRDAIAVEVERSKQELAKRGEVLRKEIEERTAELARLEKHASQTERRLSECQQAAATLKELVPPEFIQAASIAKSVAKETSPLNELQAEYNHLRAIAGMVPGSREMLSYCSTLQNDHPCKQRPDGKVTSSAWDKYQSDCRQQLAELEPKYQQALADHEAALAAAEEPLNFYLS